MKFFKQKSPPCARNILPEKYQLLLTIILSLILIVVIALIALPIEKQCHVVLRPGSIQGTKLTTRLGRKIMSYRGIRYAVAPKGRLRFKVISQDQ